MTISRSPCLIEQSNCGLTNQDTVCAKCGLDTRVRYTNEDAALLAKAQAQAKYWKTQLESDRKNELAKARDVNGELVVADGLTNKTESGESIPNSKNEQKNTDSKLEIWHEQLASKIDRPGDGELNFELYKEHFLKEWTDCNFEIVYKKRFGALMEKYGPHFGVLIILSFICTIIYRYYDGTLLLSFNYICGTLLVIVGILSIPLFVITSIGALFSMKNFKQERQIAIGKGYLKYINQVHRRI